MTNIVKFFEDKRVTTVEHRGRRVWLASEIARALGYEKSDQLSTLITGHWSEEFDEGTDHVVIRDQELKEFKALIEVTPGPGVTYAPTLTLLYESGVHLATIKCQLPAGVRLRRWLAREVLPEIRRKGSGADARRRIDLGSGGVGTLASATCASWLELDLATIILELFLA